MLLKIKDFISINQKIIIKIRVGVFNIIFMYKDDAVILVLKCV